MNASTKLQDKSDKINELESDLDPDYLPSDDEPFMNDKQLRYFELQLLKWRTDILEESRGTLNQLQDGPIREPDLNATELVNISRPGAALQSSGANTLVRLKTAVRLAAMVVSHTSLNSSEASSSM